VVVHFVDIGGIVDHYCLTFLFLADEVHLRNVSRTLNQISTFLL